MQLEPVGFTKNDLAKYPFLKETADYIRPLNLQIQDSTSAGMAQVLKHAGKKVCESITCARITRNPKQIDLEILSYPVALLLVAITENSFVRKGFALAEAKQAYFERNSTN